MAAQVTRRLGAGTCLSLTLGGTAVISALIGLSSHWAPVLVLFTVMTMLGILWNVITVSLRQAIIPSHLLGRVNSVYRFFAWGMMPIGAVIGGLTVLVVDTFASRDWALRTAWFVCAAIHVWLYVWGARPSPPNASTRRGPKPRSALRFPATPRADRVAGESTGTATEIRSPISRRHRRSALLARLLLGEVRVEPHERIHDRDPDHDCPRADVDVDPRLDGGEDHECDHEQVDHAVDPASDEAERAERPDRHGRVEQHDPTDDGWHHRLGTLKPGGDQDQADHVLDELVQPERAHGSA